MMLAGGFDFANISDIEGCGPAALKANEMGDSTSDTSGPRSIFKFFALILGSNVAPRTRKGDIVCASPSSDSVDAVRPTRDASSSSGPDGVSAANDGRGGSGSCSERSADL